MLIRVCVLFLLSVSGICAYGQSWDAGVFAGGAGYMGDLNKLNPFKVNHLAYGILGRRNFDGYWSAKLSITRGKISASDSESGNEAQRNRDLSFVSPLTEVALQGEFNFFDYQPSAGPRKFSPFIFLGGGAVFFDPENKGDSGEGTDYNKQALSAVYGAGVKYNIKGNWTLGTEIGYRTVFSGYIDGVRDRGDKRNTDVYFFTGFTLTYTFNGCKCPPVF